MPVGVNHAELCWACGCESLCVILCQQVWNMASSVKAVVVKQFVLCLVNGCESCCIMLTQSMGITVWALCQWVWIMLCYSEQVVQNHEVNDMPVGVNHGELCWASGCESRCAILSQWLWIIVNYVEPVVVKHCELCWANGCVSLCVIVGWVCGNYGMLCWASRWESRGEHCACRCESWWDMLKQWLGITLRMLCKLVWIMCYYVPIGVTHGELCWGSGCESCCVIMCQWLWIMLCYA
jgi:hypothetical protein